MFRIDTESSQRLFIFFTLVALVALFLPSIALLRYTDISSESSTNQEAGRQFDGTRYILSPSGSVSAQDPLGYNSLLEVTFFRTVPSYFFKRPSQKINFGTVLHDYDKDFLKSFAQTHGIEGVWADRNSLAREAEVTGSSLNRCNFLSSYDRYGIVLPVAQPRPHFISLLEAGEDYIYAFDPLAGRVLYPCENFLEVWEGTAFLGRHFSSKRDSPVQGS